MINNPLISVIISCYNDYKQIKRAILSVVNNSYKNLQIIVVNDCSTDKSLEVINSIKDPRILVISHDINLGCGEARRTGLKYAAGDYIIFCDSDDYYHKNAIEILYKASVKYNSDITCGKVYWVGEEIFRSEATGVRQYTGTQKFSNLFFQSNTKQVFFLQSRLIKKHLFDKVEYSKLRYIEDIPTLYRLVAHANKLVYINKGIYYYTINPNSLTNQASGLKSNIYNLLGRIENTNLPEIEPSLGSYCGEKVIKWMLGFVFTAMKNMNEEDLNPFEEEITQLVEWYKSH